MRQERRTDRTGIAKLRANVSQIAADDVADGFLRLALGGAQRGDHAANIVHLLGFTAGKDAVLKGTDHSGTMRKGLSG